MKINSDEDLERHERLIRFHEFFFSLPKWIKDAYAEDIWLYRVLQLVKWGQLKKEDFFEKLAKVMMERAKGTEKALLDHHKICMPPIYLKEVQDALKAQNEGTPGKPSQGSS